jgi:hypothetical protein
MLRWTRRALAVLSLVPLVLLLTLWLSTREFRHVVGRADDEGNALLIYASAERVTLIRATGWPFQQRWAWERDGRTARPTFDVTPRTRGGPVLGVEWADGWVDLRTAGTASAGEWLLPESRFYVFTASTGPSSLLSTTYALPIAAAAIPPLLWLPRWAWRRARTRRWQNAGRCTSCGYDLRRSGERCPECGAPTRAVR